MIHRAATSGEPGPFSVQSLSEDLHRLGVRDGDTVLCHVSLSGIGWTSGGRVALLRALLAAVGTTGTIVVPSFTTYLVDPADWRARPVPETWWDAVRATQPAFDPDLHACQPGLGVFPEVVRMHRASRRSWHPIYSFVALGARAERLTSRVELDFALGRSGVPGRLVDAGVKVLALGLPWWRRCTLFHLAESLAPFPGRRTQQMRVRLPADGTSQARWQDTRQFVPHDGDFEAIAAGIDLRVDSAAVGSGMSYCVDGAALVRRSTEWLMDNRDWRAIDWQHYDFVTHAAPPSHRGCRSHSVAAGERKGPL